MFILNLHPFGYLEHGLTLHLNPGDIRGARVNLLPAAGVFPSGSPFALDHIGSSYLVGRKHSLTYVTYM